MRRSIGLAVALAGIGLLLAWGWCAMIRMPGESYRGPMPPLSEAERELREELQGHVSTLAEQIGERNVSAYDGLVRAARYIEGSLSGYGYRVRRQPFEVARRRCENLEVEIPGSDRREEIVLIGAHYDSVTGSPGANDNATGVAAVLALARRFAGARPARTLRFVAFVNEEPPFFQTADMGSWRYAKRSRALGESLVAMLSLETLGFYSHERGSQRYPPPLGLIYPSTADFIGFVGNVQNGGLVRRLTGTFRRVARFPSEGGALPGFLPGVGWSDHWAFWQEGYPAAMVTDTALFRDPAYHTARDTAGRLQYDHLARVVAGLIEVIGELADA